jgi:hypothetical protein
VIILSDSASDKDNALNAAKTTLLSDSGRLTHDAHGSSDELPPIQTPGHSGHGSLRSGLSFVPAQGLSPGNGVHIQPMAPTSLAKAPCTCPWIPNGQGLKCLHDAAREGSVKAMRLMIQMGAVTPCLDHQGNTPLHTAITTSPYSPATVAVLAYATNINHMNDDGLTPFHLLLKRADTFDNIYNSTVHHFLTLGANPQLRFPGGETPLKMYLDGCALLEHPPDDPMCNVIHRFLEEDHNHRTRLPCREHVLEWVLELDDDYLSDHVFTLANRLCETVDIYQCNKNQFYPVNQAVRRLEDSSKFKKCIETLLDRGAEPNGLNNRGLSPLQVLFHLEQNDSALVLITEILLKHGANPMQGIDGPNWTILLASRNLPHKISCLAIKLLLSASFDRIVGSKDASHLSRSYGAWQCTWGWCWIKACKSIGNWPDVREYLEEGPNELEFQFSKPGAVVSNLALEVLTAKCVERANAYIDTSKRRNIDEHYLRRDAVALAFGDCRKSGIDIEDAWYHCLSKLCEIIAEEEL